MAASNSGGGGRRPGKNSRSSSRGNRKRGSSVGMAVVFWTAFFIFIFILFAINRETIKKNLEESQLLEIFSRQSQNTGDALQPQLDTPIEAVHEPQREIIVVPAAGWEAGTHEMPVIVQEPEAQQSETAQQPVAESQTHQPVAVVVAAQPEAQPEAQQSDPQQTAPQAETPALRERSLYLIRIDDDGDINRIRVNRQIPVSATPLTDVLNLLLAGPTRDDLNRDLRTLIPSGTKILSIEIRGSTAFINLSEDIQFNPYGAEGYVASLRQFVWTATEFPNIEDVQFLIEGKKIERLGEGIRIDIPLNRRF